MVVAILVQIEKVGAGSIGQGVEHNLVPALAHVDHALQHGPSLARGADAGNCHRRTGRYSEGVNLGPAELLIILAILLLIFGGAKLPKLARSLGQASKEFKEGVVEGASEDADEDASTTS